MRYWAFWGSLNAKYWPETRSELKFIAAKDWDTLNQVPIKDYEFHVDFDIDLPNTEREVLKLRTPAIHIITTSALFPRPPRRLNHLIK